ncbi:MAG: type IV pilus secretin PilQ [Deltaproteobacteria bacterium]|jgi:type IV pilus assembly protein PilQ|nr:type IV pilus secretin PilQ [Deltaproteobacteria bacterium]
MINALSAKLPAAFLAAVATLVLAASFAYAQMDFSPVPQSAVQQAPAGPPQMLPPAQQGPDVGSSEIIGGAYGMNANKVYTGQLITLDFQNADIHNILRLIGEVSGKNVVVSDQVSGRVTLKLKDVPWDQALDTVLDSKNLGVIENGNILRIDTKDAIARLTPDISDPATRVALVKKIFTPKYASVASLAAELDKGKSMRGSVRVIGNDIYVEDDIFTMEAITKIFMRNDRVTNQLLIEARIVEAKNEFTQNIGVNWSGGWDHQGLGEHTFNNAISQIEGDLTLNPNELLGAVDVTGGVGRLGVGFLNRAGTLALSAELTATETLGITRTVSAPRIMASNDQEVYIKQGQQIPYTSGSTANTAANTEFKEAVMELRVTPHIEENGQIVTLDITLTKDTPGSPAVVGGEPSIDTKEAKTKLMVKDGETVVIGGIISDSQFDPSSRVPGLHRIPILGWLFQSKGITNSKTELLIFITANILPMSI